MRAKVEAWNAPSPDHEGLKKFMLEQIDSSLDWRSGALYQTPPPPGAANGLRGVGKTLANESSSTRESSRAP